MKKTISFGRRPFLKMHGLGNDFVIFDARTQSLRLNYDVVRRVSNRLTGIGCDQLIVMEPSNRADVFMRIYNQDGGEVGACGNASRCVATLVGHACTIETRGGLLSATPDGASSATVDMGAPRFGWDEIPLAYPMDTLAMPVAWEGLANPAGVNVGNPHAVFFVSDLAANDLHTLGPKIEHDPLFPERVNVDVALVQDRQTILLRVWERGAGLTLACGTGACATAAAAIRRGLTDRRVTVHLPGGPLTIEWTTDNRLLMTGGVATAFTGEVDLDAYAG